MRLRTSTVGNSHSGAGATERPKWWLRRARSGATVAACVYVIVWAALLGDFANSLTVQQQVLMGVSTAVSGILIWISVRALIVQQRFLVQQENMEALEESRAFVRALMDNLPVAVWLKTLDHRYQAANLMWARYNPARASWTDRSLSHLLGHTDRELYEPDRAREFEQTDDIVVETGRRWEREYSETHEDRQITFHVIKLPVFDVRGSVVSVAGIGLDVTDQRKEEGQIRRSQEQVDMFMQRSPEHVCIMSLDRGIEFANARMCEFFGAYHSELEGRDLADLATPADRDRIIAFIERVVAEGSAGYEVVHAANATGDVRLLRISGVLVAAAHSPQSVIMVGRDVTDGGVSGADRA